MDLLKAPMDDASKKKKRSRERSARSAREKKTFQKVRTKSELHCELLLLLLLLL